MNTVIRSFRSRLVKVFICTTSVLILATFLPAPSANAATTSTVTVPMTIRPATAAEDTAMNAVVHPNVLSQSGPNINTHFTETATDFHTGRLWMADAQVTLAQCDSNVAFSIAGNHTVTHVADSAKLVVAGDEPEMGALVTDGAESTLLTVAATNSDMAVGAKVTLASPSTASTVAVINSGIRIFIYVETRDDVSQKGVQASFTYAGTPQLQVTYDASGCTAATTTSTPVTIPVAVKGKTVTKKLPVQAAPVQLSTPTTQAAAIVENVPTIKGSKIVVGSSSAQDIQNLQSAGATSVQPVVASTGGFLNMPLKTKYIFAGSIIASLFIISIFIFFIRRRRRAY